MLKKRWINYVKCTVALDFINSKVVLCFDNNWIGRKGEIKMLNTIIICLVIGDIMYFSISFYYNASAYN